MSSFIQYWEHISSAHRVLILMGGMVFFWLLEGYYPLFRFSFKRYKHAGVNLVFLACTLVLNVIFGYTTIKICAWVEQNHFGLLYLINMPVWVKIIVTLLLLDFFGQYAPHYLMHKVKWMWKFHMIHHSDTKVDVTTGTRHHPGEWLFRETFTVLGVLILGIPIAYYFLYRSVSGLFTHFNHANIRMPLWLDKPISWIFVSPNMHKVHHHFERPLTDTNFANIFSLWDRLFGTYAYEDPRKLKYGLDVLEGKNDEDIAYQFKLPFDKTIKTDY
ncbi:MAG: sterol desaturase family protein [Chitinophagaceae bacterium]|nr:sterol desaturase family protein [Chitinophagaceae bacterium]